MANYLDNILSSYSNCGFLKCGHYFLAGLLLSIFILTLINIWLYRFVKHRTKKYYPEKPCSGGHSLPP